MDSTAIKFKKHGRAIALMLLTTLFLGCPLLDQPKTATYEVANLTNYHVRTVLYSNDTIFPVAFDLRPGATIEGVYYTEDGVYDISGLESGVHLIDPCGDDGIFDCLDSAVYVFDNKKVFRMYFPYQLGNASVCNYLDAQYYTLIGKCRKKDTECLFRFNITQEMYEMADSL